MVSGGYYVVKIPEAEIPSDWFHIVLEFIGPDTGMKAYIDGVFKASHLSKVPRTPPISSGTNFVLGRGSVDEDDKYSTISVDEIMFWEQELSGEEISCLAGVACS